MRTITTNPTVLVLSFIVLVLAFFAFNQAQPASASVRTGDEYMATTTNVAAQPVRTLKAGYGALGQVTITGAAAGQFILYDATTSDVTLRTGQIATTSLPVIADFPASTAAGTYLFDARFVKGLLLSSSGTAATTSIMYK